MSSIVKCKEKGEWMTFTGIVTTICFIYIYFFFSRMSHSVLFLQRDVQMAFFLLKSPAERKKTDSEYELFVKKCIVFMKV